MGPQDWSFRYGEIRTPGPSPIAIQERGERLRPLQPPRARGCELERRASNGWRLAPPTLLASMFLGSFVFWVLFLLSRGCRKQLFATMPRVVKTGVVVKTAVALELDLWALTIWIPLMVPCNLPEVQLVSGGSTAPSGSIHLVFHGPLHRAKGNLSSKGNQQFHG